MATTKLSKPLGSYKLANKLKSSHCYITGSRYEAGALHIRSFKMWLTNYIF